ncbi:conserved hypothetical protein [Rubrivivax sp. A210]|uniref:DUF3275 family protein n=1 Tax=Rubrivivax sp. A210 TaxID=2772301 RepID=UPI001919F6F3|nr:DUF3275 family protein [Rubrivivax sp. A210]CAD5366586.1 conserved hypothetical protein [Rubrivivax sp. A210]
MSIFVRGTITIQRKTGARGAFSIGDLATEIGEFEVKDPLIEEFEPGKYTGAFLIKWIAPDSFTWRGRVFVKNRATLEEILIDVADEGADAPSTPPEPDPLDHAPEPAKPAGMPVPEIVPELVGGNGRGDQSQAASADLVLFGEELIGLVQSLAPIKLDPTVDRQRFREQRDRLKELGYAFDAKAQTWSIKEHAGA